MLLLSILIIFYHIADFLPFLFFLWVKAINIKSHMKARTTEEILQPKDCAWQICPSTGQVWWPGEKTGDENEQISLNLQSQRSPAAFQALGVSGAIPTGETRCSD